MIIKQMYSGGGEFVLSISANSSAPNIPSLAAAAGWNSQQKLIVNITSTYINRLRLLSSWNFPMGLILNISASTLIGGSNASGQKDAIVVQIPVTINNLGTIAGAGGAGGTGGLAYAYYSGTSSPGVQAGGNGGVGQGFRDTIVTTPAAALSGDSGAYGVYSGAVLGGETAPYAQGGTGGTGGSWGQSGSNGGYGSYGGSYASAGLGDPSVGESAGNSISGNSFVTWQSTGTRLGAIS